MINDLQKKTFLQDFETKPDSTFFDTTKKVYTIFSKLVLNE